MSVNQACKVSVRRVSITR